MKVDDGSSVYKYFVFIISELGFEIVQPSVRLLLLERCAVLYFE